MAAHKKHEIKPSASADVSADSKAMADMEEKPEEKSAGTKSKETKAGPEVTLDVLTEKIEIIEKEDPAKSPSKTDPLGDFKEKMVKEELSASDNVPRKNYMWPILFIFIITILILVGAFLYRSETNTVNKVEVAAPTLTPVVTPEPTKKTIDRAQYEIEVQNGSEVSGEAARQKDNLEEEGFVVSSIGNADNSDYTDTIIQIKEEVDTDFVAELKSVLSGSFTVFEAETLPEDASTPIIIILGTKK